MTSSLPDSTAGPSRAARIRAQLNHPVIDADGHLCEHLPTFVDYLKDTAGSTLADEFLATRRDDAWSALSPEERRRRRVWRPSWWSYPARNTLDRATAMMPALMRERMDDFGIDFMIAYTSIGISLVLTARDELRQAGCRALNRMLHDLCRGQEDRITPAAVIPLFTPQEAIAELDYAVEELGMKAVMIGSNVRRPVSEGMRDTAGALVDASWVDTLSVDSLYDYDPVWARCMALKVAPTSHAPSTGWDVRSSVSSYVYNHIGSFASAGEAFCKGLVLGGVTRRFPELNFGFLEGGVAWACELYAGLVGHCDKRNRKSLTHLGPSLVDSSLLSELAGRYGGTLYDADTDLGGMAGAEDPSLIDEFAAAGIETPLDLRARFEPNFYFGCEADDRLAALAFDSAKLPFGARLKATFSSDIGHWDVPDMNRVLEEAYELCEDELLSAADFRDFTFTHPAMLHAGMNPGFFKGTAVEEEVDKLLSNRTDEHPGSTAMPSGIADGKR